MNSPSALTCSSRPLSHTNPQKPLGSCTAGEQASLRAQAAGAVVDSNVLTGKGMVYTFQGALQSGYSSQWSLQP